MSSNPVNLAVRFILEIIALAILGYRGWILGSGFMRYVWALLFPIAGAALWGIFRVPGDASHSGDAPVHVPGWVRLGLELAIFAVATWALISLEKTNLATIYGVCVSLHYILSWDRILWLLRS
jgi:hypothetical protein